MLANAHTPDVDPSNTKWIRIYNAFVGLQNERQFGNHVVLAINYFMNLASYTDNPNLFEERRNKLNVVLALCGMAINDGGKVINTPKAKNLDEALKRADHLKIILTQRNVHQEVLKYCRAEIIQDNYFHAVLEAMKSITAKIRLLSGVDADGASLVDAAFSFGKSPQPILAINALNSESQKNEQKGFVNLLKGMYGMVRNPLAHEPKIEWKMTDQDAADILSMVSLVHRKLDNTIKYSSLC
jgi:uncharacterized protein (TIGR02391 family)